MIKPEIQRLGCEPYCSLMRQCLKMLAVYPFKTPEADYAITEIGKAVRAINETRFEKAYYEARKEIAFLVEQLEELRGRHER